MLTFSTLPLEKRLRDCVADLSLASAIADLPTATPLSWGSTGQGCHQHMIRSQALLGSVLSSDLHPCDSMLAELWLSAPELRPQTASANPNFSVQTGFRPLASHMMHRATILHSAAGCAHAPQNPFLTLSDNLVNSFATGRKYNRTHCTADNGEHIW